MVSFVGRACGLLPDRLKSRHCDDNGLLVESHCARRRTAAGDADMISVQSSQR